MSMKTSVVIADGTFSTNTAPLLGPIDEVVRKAAKIGYDAISATVDRPEAEYIRSFRSPALRLQLDSIHLHTNGELDFYPKILALEGLVGQVDISDGGPHGPRRNALRFSPVRQGFEGNRLSGLSCQRVSRRTSRQRRSSGVGLHPHIALKF